METLYEFQNARHIPGAVPSQVDASSLMQLLFVVSQKRSPGFESKLSGQHDGDVAVGHLRTFTIRPFHGMRPEHLICGSQSVFRNTRS